MFNHKRRLGRTIFLPLILIAVFLLTTLVGCNRKVNPLVVNEGEFSVHFLDVGEGDSILINLPDGKNMLIDTGNTSEVVADYVISCVGKTDKERIDYLVVTHPDSDHVGNLKAVVDRFSVGTAFVPDVRNPERFPAYYEALSVLENSDTIIKVSGYWQLVCESDYYFAFLSPAPTGEEGSSYDDLNGTTFPSSTVINDVSPIIYFECKGSRFVFTGDAGKSQEKLVLDNYTVKAYDFMYGKDKINLTDIDVLKVAHHGADGSSSEEFLNLLKPKNVVISVGKNNYGHPSTAVLERILKINPNVNFLRTDQKGTISMRFDGNFNLKTDA